MASDPLFARCNLCDGTRVTVRPAVVDGYRRITLDESGKPVARNVTGHLPAGEPCPCTQSKTPGFAETGLTMRQVERIRDDHDTLLVELAGLIDGIGYSTLGPSPVVALVAFVHRYLSDPRRKTRVAYLRACPPGTRGGTPTDDEDFTRRVRESFADLNTRIRAVGPDHMPVVAVQWLNDYLWVGPLPDCTAVRVIDRNDRYRRVIAGLSATLHACLKNADSPEAVRADIRAALDAAARERDESGNDPVVTTPREEICPHGQNSSDGPSTIPLADTAVSPALVVCGPEVGSAVAEPVPEGLAEGGASEAADGGFAGRVRDGGRGEAG